MKKGDAKESNRRNLKDFLTRNNSMLNNSFSWSYEDDPINQGHIPSHFVIITVINSLKQVQPKW
jgi:hypothetical protein